MHCEEAESLLGQLVFDDLHPEVKKDLRAHVEACEKCRALAGDMRVAAKLLTEGVHAGPEPKLSEERKETLKAAAAKGPRKKARVPHRRAWHVPGGRIVEVAAVLLVVFILAGLLLPALSPARERARRTHKASLAKQEEYLRALEAEDAGTAAEPSLSVVAPSGGEELGGGARTDRGFGLEKHDKARGPREPFATRTPVPPADRKAEEKPRVRTKTPRPGLRPGRPRRGEAPGGTAGARERDYTGTITVAPINGSFEGGGLGRMPRGEGDLVGMPVARDFGGIVAADETVGRSRKAFDEDRPRRGRTPEKPGEGRPLPSTAQRTVVDKMLLRGRETGIIAGLRQQEAGEGAGGLAVVGGKTIGREKKEPEVAAPGGAATWHHGTAVVEREPKKLAKGRPPASAPVEVAGEWDDGRASGKPKEELASARERVKADAYPATVPMTEIVRHQAPGRPPGPPPPPPGGPVKEFRGPDIARPDLPDRRSAEADRKSSESSSRSRAARDKFGRALRRGDRLASDGKAADALRAYQDAIRSRAGSRLDDIAGKKPDEQDLRPFLHALQVKERPGDSPEGEYDQWVGSTAHVEREAPRGPSPRELAAEKLVGKAGEEEKKAAVARSRYFADVGGKFFEEMNYQEARESLQRAVALDPSNKQARERLDKVYDILGTRVPEVRTSLERLAAVKRVAVQDKLVELDNALGTAEQRLNKAGKKRDPSLGEERALAEKIRDANMALEAAERAGEIIKWMPYDVKVDEKKAEAEKLAAKARSIRDKELAVLREEKLKSGLQRVGARRAEDKRLREQKMEPLMDQVERFFADGEFAQAEKLAKEVVKLDPTNYRADKLVAKARKARDEALSALGVDLGTEVAQAERWISEHPKEPRRAIRRLKALLPTVRGTALEKRVESHMRRLSAAVEKASARKNPRLRETEALETFARVKRLIRQTPESDSAHKDNVALLTEAMQIAKGTEIEDAVLQELEREKDALLKGKFAQVRADARKAKGAKLDYLTRRLPEFEGSSYHAKIEKMIERERDLSGSPRMLAAGRLMGLEKKEVASEEAAKPAPGPQQFLVLSQGEAQTIEKQVQAKLAQQLRRQLEAAREPGAGVIEEIEPEPEVEVEEAPPEAEAAAAPAPLPPVNPFVMTAKDRFSTFAMDVDTASYTIARKYIRSGYRPPARLVRMEEFVNAFDYNYPKRSRGVFDIHSEGMPSPFGKDLQLLKIGIQARIVGREGRRPAHLVFVIDTSGSMEKPDRIALVKYALALLVGELAPEDLVTVVSYGTRPRLVLEGVSASKQDEIIRAIRSLQCSGSTNMIAGLRLGYEQAQRRFRAGAVNRVILCSDGVANVGASEAEEILKHIERFRDWGITLTVAGFGAGSYNDRMLESLADSGDGHYIFVDSRREARRVFVEELGATLHTVAKDAKIQVEFDPKRVRRYRLVGYENRDIADKDFRNDAIDAGEVGSGQSVTALYEIELLNGYRLPQREAGLRNGRAKLRPGSAGCWVARDIGTAYVRYRNILTGKVEEISHRLWPGSVAARRRPGVRERPRLYLAACVAEFAEILRLSEHARDGDLAEVERLLVQVVKCLPLDRKVRELARLVRRAKGLQRAE